MDKLGPKGGNGGQAWEFADVQKWQKMIVYYNPDAIVGISFQYIDTNGVQRSFSKVGSSINLPRELNFSNGEFITSIEGTYGIASIYTVVTSLTVHTNITSHKFSGREESGKFSLTPPDKNAKVVGFHGRTSGYLDAIGIITKKSNQPELIGGQGPQGQSGGGGFGGIGEGSQGRGGGSGPVGIGGQGPQGQSGGGGFGGTGQGSQGTGGGSGPVGIGGQGPQGMSGGRGSGGGRGPEGTSGGSGFGGIGGQRPQ